MTQRQAPSPLQQVTVSQPATRLQDSLRIAVSRQPSAVSRQRKHTPFNKTPSAISSALVFPKM